MSDEDRARHLAGELNREGPTPDGIAVGGVLCMLEIARQDSARLDWLEKRFGLTLGGLLAHYDEDPDEEGLRTNIDVEAKVYPEGWGEA